MWVRIILCEFLHEQEEQILIFCDNKLAIALSINRVFHEKSKHIDTWYHFIREMIHNDEISVTFCKLEDQFVDMFSKPLATELFEINRENIGVSMV